MKPAKVYPLRVWHHMACTTEFVYCFVVLCSTLHLMSVSLADTGKDVTDLVVWVILRDTLGGTR